MDIAFKDDYVINLLVALVIGGLIGAEREYRDKAAGFRTIIFICVGSAMFTMLSIKLSDTGDPARIAAQIVTGVGFLGGGAILRQDERIVGLTTAASIWLTAALGMAAGAGHFGLAIVSTVFILVVLWVFPYLEHLIDRASHAETYHIVTQNDDGIFEELRQLFAACGLYVVHAKRTKTTTGMVSTWAVYGAMVSHQRLTDQLLAHQDVLEFRL